MTERELMTLLRAQPERALPLLIERYGGLVLSVLRAKTGSLTQPEDREELASDCFLALFQMRDRIDPDKGSLASLLASIAQKKAVDHLRRIGRRPQSDPLGDEPLLAVSLPDPTKAYCDRAALLLAIRDLGEPDAAILFRKYYLGESHRAIGAALGLSENAVTKRLRRSLETLRNAMKGETFDG